MLKTGVKNNPTKEVGQSNQIIRHLGKHLVFDLWDCVNLNSVEIVEQALSEAVKVCGATLLYLKTHSFSPYGVSGFAMLSESHISIHTWPEHKYAAIDIFTCGERVVPYNSLPVFRKFFKPKHMEIVDLKRGSML